MKNREIFLDTETTGFSTNFGDRVIEIGAVESINRKLTGEIFHAYLSCDKNVSIGSYKVHGLSDSFLKNHPKFSEIKNDLIQFVKESTIIIHNAKFDVRFLDHELKLCGDFTGIENYCNGIIDSLEIARKKFPKKRNNLDSLAKRLNVSDKKRDLHGALSDSFLLADVYFLMTLEQGKIFNSKEERSKNLNKKINYNNKEFKVKVVEPSKEEIDLHNDFIKKINK